MQTWIAELRQLGPQNLVLAIAGNKVDLEASRQVSTLLCTCYFHVSILYPPPFKVLFEEGTQFTFIIIGNLFTFILGG